MAFFDFLKPVEKTAVKVAGGAFHFLNSNPAFNVIDKGVQTIHAVQNRNQTPQQVNMSSPDTGYDTTARNLLISSGRSIARAPETVTRSALQLGANAGVPLHNAVFGTHNAVPNFSQPTENNGLKEAIYGKEPVQTYQQRGSGIQQTLNKTKLSPVATPFAFLGTGLNIAGDITGLSGIEKHVSQDVVEQLAKETSETAVKNLLKNKVAPEVAAKIAPAIVQTKDANIVRNIITRATESPTNPELGQSVLGNLATKTADQIAPAVNDIAVHAHPQIFSDVSNPAKVAETAATPSNNPFDEILHAVSGTPAAPGQAPERGLASLRAEQNDILNRERGQRFTSVSKLGESQYGDAGYFQRRAALKGEYTKLDNPYVDKFSPEQSQQLFVDAQKKIYSTPDSVYERNWKENGLKNPLHASAAKFNTEVAVRKVLGLEPGIPTDSEIRLLGVHSPELAQVAKDAQPPKSIGRKIFDAASTLFGSSRSAKSTLDFSMGGRQGIFVAARHPADFAAANAASVRYAADKAYYAKDMVDLAEDPWIKVGIDRKLDLTALGGHEEAYPTTDIVGKVPGVQGAERAYTGGLTKLRALIFKSRFQQYGDTPEEALKNLGENGVRGLTEAVNTLTGRGGKAGGWVEKHATTLQEALFSPRLWASRLEPLNPAFWKRIGPAGRREAFQSLGSFAAVAGTVLSAAVAAGATVETDPRSSDFLKIKVGDTRYDILGGFQQNLVFGARQALGLSNTIAKTDFNTTKSSVTGKLSKYGEGFGAPTQLSAAYDLVRNKSNPVLGAAASILEGKDKAGNSINPLTEIGQLFVPINIQQAFDARHNPKDVLKGLPDIVGIGSQTYGMKDINVSAKQKQIISKLTDKNQQQAYTRFYQTVKTGPDRTQTADDIKKALTNGDTAKAKLLATAYNQKYKSNFSEWSKQYGKYAKDKNLVKEYKSNLITDATIQRYISTIKKGQQP